MVNVLKHCSNLHDSIFIRFIGSQFNPSQLTRKKSLLLAFKILGLLFNTLDEADKYPVLIKDNLIIPIQMQLSDKQKLFPNSQLYF